MSVADRANAANPARLLPIRAPRAFGNEAWEGIRTGARSASAPVPAKVDVGEATLRLQVGLRRISHNHFERQGSHEDRVARLHVDLS